MINFNTYSPGEFDINIDIEKYTDVEDLKKLEQYVDDSIANIGTGNYKLREMKAKMRNMSVEDLEEQQLHALTKLKLKIMVMKEKMLNETELLSIKRLRAKKIPYEDIAERIGITVERVKAICKQKRK